MNLLCRYAVRKQRRNGEPTMKITTVYEEIIIEWRYITWLLLGKRLTGNRIKNRVLFHEHLRIIALIVGQVI